MCVSTSNQEVVHESRKEQTKKQVTQILTFSLFFLRKKGVQELIIVAQICQAFYNKDAKLIDELLSSISNIKYKSGNDNNRYHLDEMVCSNLSLYM